MKLFCCECGDRIYPYVAFWVKDESRPSNTAVCGKCHLKSIDRIFDDPAVFHAWVKNYF